ncbi:zgc:171566 isoform X2 [Pseudoliparis swirei]|uniref:zgc:171566 isoform X2 n=1 Tax=Pseudoliparis swirei TaxID=2059687 RepID=UPI0024BDC328|nr:zgc:171566 isoform X2 [Pseudoliparis swirei]
MLRALLCACLLAAHLCAAGTSRTLNLRPVIVNLTKCSMVITRCNRKCLEGTSQNLAPTSIWMRINLTETDYRNIFFSINGLLLPGGNVDLETSQFSRASRIFYDLALRANKAGDFFPIWGTCQGLQQLSVLTADQNLLTDTDTEAVALPLNLTPAAESSRLFRNFPKDLMQNLAEENITSNFHRWSLSVQNFSQSALLKRFYKVLSTNSDGEKEFISTMEAHRYPFYAVQWHPEKSSFEWTDKPGMVHSTAAVRASFYTGGFFVSEEYIQTMESLVSR